MKFFKKIILGIGLLNISLSLEAHEPVFSVGPETIWKGGTAVEVEYEREASTIESKSDLETQLLYGVTSDLTLAVNLPFVLKQNTAAGRSSGLGDVRVKLKYQPWRKDLPGAQYKFTLLAGASFAAADSTASPPLGSGKTDYLAGFSYGYESRSWYHFLTGRWLFRGIAAPQASPDAALLDAALGYRFWRSQYAGWDLVPLIEFNSFIVRGQRAVLWLGPTALFSPSPIWMFKAGWQLAVADGAKIKKTRATLAIETHF